MITMTKPYLLFDAGGTIVFPDFDYLSKTAAEFGIRVTTEELFQIHSELIYRLDFMTSQKKIFVDPFPKSFARTLFNHLDPMETSTEAFFKKIEKRNNSKSLWQSTNNSVIDALTKLKNNGYQMSVISNSDGRVYEILESLGILKFFDEVFDSEILDVSKPDPKIFEIAINQLSIHPEKSLYIGDIFYLDIWGANNAGLGAIHLDPLNLYKGWPGVHLPGIFYLPEWLDSYSSFPSNYNLYPLRHQEIKCLKA